MPADMKEIIAEAAQTLLTERHIKKLTVKDIVEQCHITRQAFYYHFEDIPDLFSWMIKRFTEQVFQEASSKGDAEEGLRCFFVMAVNALPYAQRGRDSNYRDELEQTSRRYIQQFFAEAAESQNYYQQYSAAEAKIILRYHSQAILGLLQEWTEQDTEQLDQIVHTVYRLLMEGIPPKPKN
ncbi:MAG TPA: TetR family transcriptional regulator [Candidatus Fimivicinus intestinavium]|nr:TetR family transcriptional regulator [Candidatus Fimivicinus intestinavium]